jgi:hypothetical protein
MNSPSSGVLDNASSYNNENDANLLGVLPTNSSQKKKKKIFSFTSEKKIDKISIEGLPSSANSKSLIHSLTKTKTMIDDESSTSMRNLLGGASVTDILTGDDLSMGAPTSTL